LKLTKPSFSFCHNKRKQNKKNALQKNVFAVKTIGMVQAPLARMPLRVQYALL